MKYGKIREDNPYISGLGGLLPIFSSFGNHREEWRDYYNETISYISNKVYELELYKEKVLILDESVVNDIDCILLIQFPSNGLKCWIKKEVVDYNKDVLPEELFRI